MVGAVLVEIPHFNVSTGIFWDGGADGVIVLVFIIGALGFHSHTDADLVFGFVGFMQG